LRLTLCVATLWLAGCAAVPPHDAAATARPLLANITAFSFDGRLSARQGERPNHANISWRHTAAGDDILLTTPLGQGVAEITRDASGARLVGADGQVMTASDWRALAARAFGFELPLGDLARWVLGDAPATQRDALGRTETATADGWQMRYLDYESAAPNALPVLMEFRRDDIELRLKVDAWQMP